MSLTGSNLYQMDDFRRGASGDVTGDDTGDLGSAEAQDTALWKAPIRGALDARRRGGSHIEHLESEIAELREQVVRLGGRIVVMVETLAPESLRLAKPFHANVEPHEGGFSASFVDANLMAFGETQPEALWNLKDLIASTFETLSRIGKGRLGPGPNRQLAVLRAFIES